MVQIKVLILRASMPSMTPRQHMDLQETESSSSMAMRHNLVLQTSEPLVSAPLVQASELALNFNGFCFLTAEAEDINEGGAPESPDEGLWKSESAPAWSLRAVEGEAASPVGTDVTLANGAHAAALVAQHAPSHGDVEKRMMVMKDWVCAARKDERSFDLTEGLARMLATFSREVLDNEDVYSIRTEEDRRAWERAYIEWATAEIQGMATNLPGSGPGATSPRSRMAGRRRSGTRSWSRPAISSRSRTTPQCAETCKGSLGIVSTRRRHWQPEALPPAQRQAGMSIRVWLPRRPVVSDIPSRNSNFDC